MKKFQTDMYSETCVNNKEKLHFSFKQYNKTEKIDIFKGKKN